MKKIISLLSVLALTALATNSGSAKVKTNSVPGTVLEESMVTIKGKKLNSKSNPLKVVLSTVDGQNVTLPVKVKAKGTKADVFMPSVPDVVSGLVQVVLTISGGNVDETDAEKFAVILSQRPAGAPSELDTTTISSLPVLLETTDAGLGITGEPGPQGEIGETGPQGAPGSPGPVGPIPGTYPGSNITGTVAQAAIVTNATQSNITTLPNLASAGATGNTISFPGNTNTTGSVTAGSFSGPLTGNVTGNLTGTVLTATQSSITSIPNVATLGKTGLTTNFPGSTNTTGSVTAGSFSGPLTGAVTGNVTGNLTGTVLTATQNSVTTMTGLATIGSTGNTVNFPGSIAAVANVSAGSFTTTGAVNTGSVVATGNISAASFSGPVAGTVTGNVTGDLTGQVLTATQSNITTLPALVSAGTTGVATNFAGPVTAPEGITADVTGNLTGNIQTAAQNSITTMLGLVTAGTAGVQTQFNGPVKGNQGFIGNITGNVVGNVSGNLAGNADSATNAVNVTGASQPGITSLGGLNLVGTVGSTVSFLGGASVAQDLSVTGVINGNLNGSATTFTGNLGGDVTGGMTTTAIAPAVVYGKALTAPYAAAAGVVAAADDLKTVIAKLDGNTAAAAGTGATNAANIATNTANIATNVSDIATNAADIAALDAVASLEVGAASLTISGTNDVTLATTADVTLTLPATAGTLALEPVVASAIDMEALATFSAANTNIVTLTDSTPGTIETITSISGGVLGQRLTIILSEDMNISDVAGLNLDTAFAGNAGDLIELIYVSGAWNEVSRSVNSN